MVVILAGCDGTGKSTCFDKLRKSMNANFIKESYTNDDLVKFVRIQYTSAIARESDLTIYDRATILDDIVYSQVMANRYPSWLPEQGTRDYNQLIYTLDNCLIVYFNLDDAELQRRLDQRGDEYITPNQVNKIKYWYNRVFGLLGLTCKEIDVTGLSEDQVYYKVKEIIEAYEKFKNC